MTHIRTQAVHAGQPPDPLTGAITTAIAQTTSFTYGTLEQGAALFSGETEGWTYSRWGNPTNAALETKLAALENGERAVAFSSGMAAVAGVVLGLLNPGDEIAFLGPLYGGTEAHFHELSARFGIRVIAVRDGDLAASLTEAMRLIWVETPTNPTLRLHDLAAIAAIGRARNVLTLADNTLCTPCLTRPLDHGIDLVLHSMTKYLGGHGDAIGGAVIGRDGLIGRIRQVGLNHLGGCLAPHTAFLFLRGLKTLPLRMAAHCEGAARVATFLDKHPAVRRVYYPGLTNHPNHALARRQMSTGFGGVVAFDLSQPGRHPAAALLDRLRLFTQAVSLGDVSSLACHPASTTHSFISAEARAEHGIGEGLVRLSIGIEHPDDLIADLEQALARLDNSLSSVEFVQ